MSVVTVPTKDIGDVKDTYRKSLECKKTLEDRHEDYIKRELGILE